MFKKSPARKAKPRPQVHDRALALAARRMRSEHELRKKLLSEGYGEEEINTSLARLKEIYLLDDSKMALAVGRQYKDRGNRFITQKLKEKGIRSEEHTPALQELPDELERALAAGEKKLRSLKALEARVVAQKLYQHLALRGFGGSVVQKVVRQLTAGAEIDED
jgi:regulatory protein